MLQGVQGAIGTCHHLAKVHIVAEVHVPFSSRQEAFQMIGPRVLLHGTYLQRHTRIALFHDIRPWTLTKWHAETANDLVQHSSARPLHGITDRVSAHALHLPGPLVPSGFLQDAGVQVQGRRQASCRRRPPPSPPRPTWLTGDASTGQGRSSQKVAVRYEVGAVVSCSASIAAVWRKRASSSDAAP